MNQPPSSSKNDGNRGRLRSLLGSKRVSFRLGRGSVSEVSRRSAPGSAPGIEADDLVRRPSDDQPVRVTCFDYAPDNVQFEEVTDTADFIVRHRPPWSRVRWINVEGLTQMDVIRALAKKYELHPLAVEDVLHTVQRPKVEDYPATENQLSRLFIVARTIEAHDGHLSGDQISFFLGRNTLITFQEIPGDSFDPVRQRIRKAGSRLRQNDVSFLMYALMDAIVDNYFPVLERYSERLEEMEEQLVEKPDKDTFHEIHAIKRELLLIRRAVWPMRELISQLQRDRHECLSDAAQTYFRDVHDHCVQIIDLVETYREIVGAMTEMYISSVSNRMNEIMKVLTVMGSIFIPLTFLAGVYGMNMPIPEARWPGTYPIFWAACATIAGGMLLWFRRRGWM